MGNEMKRHVLNRAQKERMLYSVLSYKSDLEFNRRMVYERLQAQNPGRTRGFNVDRMKRIMRRYDRVIKSIDVLLQHWVEYEFKFDFHRMVK